MEEDVLNEIKKLGATYRSEIANRLHIDRMTVDRQLRNLLKRGWIERIDLTLGPEPHIVARLDELKDAGMKENHFKNAIWYRIVE